MTPLRQWVTTNAGLKIVAILLAVVTWFFVQGITSDKRIIEVVPLEIVPRPGQLLLHQSASTVSVVIRGTLDDLRQVQRADFAARIDLTAVKDPGRHTVALGPDIIRHPPRVQVVQVVPPSVTVQTDESLERTVPVKPVLTGEVPPGYIIERTNLVPAQVQVRGPRSLVIGMTEIETLPIDLTGRRISFRERVQLALPDPNVTLVKRNAVEADLRIAEASR